MAQVLSTIRNEFVQDQVLRGDDANLALEDSHANRARERAVVERSLPEREVRVATAEGDLGPLVDEPESLRPIGHAEPSLAERVQKTGGLDLADPNDEVRVLGRCGVSPSRKGYASVYDEIAPRSGENVDGFSKKLVEKDAAQGFFQNLARPGLGGRGKSGWSPHSR